jgi:hypothetical protein
MYFIPTPRVLFFGSLSMRSQSNSSFNAVDSTLDSIFAIGFLFAPVKKDGFL